MRRLLSILALALACRPPAPVLAEDASRLVRESEGRTANEERNGFHLPEGFEIELFADDAQVGGKPINLAFDARGRLWVTSTREYPFAVKRENWSADTTRALGAKDTIRILEDTDGDGRADKVTLFADDLNIPTGLQPWKNGCIAWSIPNILFLEDTQHQGRAEKADKRSILFGPLGYEKDTHGMISSMRLGLDGWIYATHGFSNTSHFQVLPQNRKPNQEPGTKNQETLDITSGSVFRFRPDGSAIELWTSGQVNPFGLCWDSWGNLYSADCHSSPIYQLIRGATYPQFGKPADALGFGPVMCEHAHGSTGICGPIYIDGGVWGPEWDDHMFVCNPVTSKINHDRITFTGSTPKANEEPDFLTSDDGWFRPVDLQLGPDGALYIADFYNRIIGHYEVPLDDPRRDRSHGRIWRVVRKGYTGKLAACDLTSQTDVHLSREATRGANVNRRHLAASELMNRDAGALHPQNGKTNFVFPRDVHGQPATKAQLGRSIVSNMADLPDAGQLGTLIPMLRETPSEDLQLRHAVRVATRNVLQLPGAYDALSGRGDMAALRTELTRISCAVPTADAANWLLEQLKTSSAGSSRHEEALNQKPKAPAAPPTRSRLSTSAALPDRALLTQVLTHIARHLPAEREGELVELVQQHFGEDLDTQLDLFAAVREGRAARKDNVSVLRDPPPPDDKNAIGPSVRSWTETLARRLADSLSTQQNSDWQPAASSHPQPAVQNPASASPWFRLARPCNDGKERPMLDSHPPGGEALTGTLRSKTFDLPPTLSFWLAGHRGFPTAPAHEKNFVRLVDADTGHEIGLAFPPRHNTAKRITWQTGKMPAKRAYLELVDGDDATAYAWLAAGGFEPPVVDIPDLGSPSRDRRIRAAAELAALTRITTEGPDARRHARPAFPELVKLIYGLPNKETYSADTRAALAAASLWALWLWPREVMELARDPALAPAVLSMVYSGPPEKSEELATAIRALPSREQVKLASALATSPETARALMAQAPPRVLADPLVAGKLKALGDDAITHQLAGIVAKLPPQSDAVNALIAARLKSYDPGKADADRGSALFAQVCTVCHRIGIKGNLVGPQLDGIGARGPERLLEDILDPNRAVDPAFRLHIVRLKNGEVVAGLLRREQDDALTFADAAAQEHVVSKADVVADQTSEFSLMPSGLGEALTEEQVHDLLKFLLDRK